MADDDHRTPATHARAPDAGDPGLLRPWGWSDRIAALVDACDVTGMPARVSRVTRRRFDVQAADGPRTIPLAALPSGVDPPVTGDWVLLDVDTDPAILAAVLPRWSLLARTNALGSNEQLLAANVDTVFAVHGLDRPMKVGRLERTLAVGLDGGANAVVVLTKADSSPAAHTAEVVAEVAEATRGLPCVVTSSRTGEGLDELHQWLRDDRTVVLLGESGAGKSRLVNTLLGEAAQSIGEVREGDAKGRHTTTTRDLYPAPGGGVLLDTPGLRSMGLWDVGDGVAQVFDDIEDLVDQCRFADCAHATEPGCAVQAAVAAGTIDGERVARWLAYIDELDSAENQRVERERLGKGAGKANARAARAFYANEPGRRQKGRRS
jgi:ribosome biogenesis GTPase